MGYPIMAVEYTRQRKISGKRVKNFLIDQAAMIFFGLVFILALIFVPNYNNLQNLYNILIQSCDLIILACGCTFVFLNGGIDFSATAVLPMGSVICATILTSIQNTAISIPLAILAVLLMALIIGAINGFSVAQLKMPSFMATMATQLVFCGIALTVTQSQSIGGVPKAFCAIEKGSIFGVRYPVIITLVVVAVLYYLLNKTYYGRQLISLGTNHSVSRISGLKIKKLIFSIFLISAGCSALASILMTARLGSGVPALGEDMLMDVVAAVVIGGTSNTGGEGRLIGSVLGAIIVRMLSNILNLLGLDWYYITACKGFVIIGLSLLNNWRKYRRT